MNNRNTIEPTSFTLLTLWNLVEIGRHTGNAWLRFAGYLQLWWFGLLLGVALFPVNGLIAVLTFMPILTILLLLRVEPAGLIATSGIKKTKDEVEKLVRTANTIAGVQVAIGIAAWLIPMHNDRGLVPWFVATLAAVVLIGIGKKLMALKMLLILLSATMAVIFFLGGREAVKEFSEEIGRTKQTQQVAPQQASGYHQNIFGFSNNTQNTVNNVVKVAPPAPPTTIRINKLPEVSITSPVHGDVFKKLQHINFSILASDDVEIAFVNIYANGALIGNLTSPYTLTRFLEMEGEIELIAVAFDSDYAVTYSEPVIITINSS